jgi:hypothetical protein
MRRRLYVRVWHGHRVYATLARPVMGVALARYMGVALARYMGVALARYMGVHHG